MVFQVKFEWKIDGIEDSVEFYKLSPIFTASPDEDLHYWQVGINVDPRDTHSYIIFIILSDRRQSKRNIFSKFNYKIHNNDNELVAEGTSNENEYAYIDKLKFSKVPITIFFEVMISRKQLCSWGSMLAIEQSPNTVTAKDLLLKLYENEDFTAITIKCDDREFKVHKTILVSRSPVFEAMFKNEMTENLSKTIDLSGIDPEAINIFLKYLYGTVQSIPPALLEDVLGLGDKYDLDDLKQICGSGMLANLDVSTVIKFLVAADLYRMSQLKRTFLDFLKTNLNEVMRSAAWITFLTNNVGLVNELFTLIASP